MPLWLEKRKGWNGTIHLPNDARLLRKHPLVHLDPAKPWLRLVAIRGSGSTNKPDAKFNPVTASQCSSGNIIFLFMMPPGILLPVMKLHHRCPRQPAP